MSRLTMFQASGFGQFKFPGSKMQIINYNPSFIIHQFFSKGTIPFETTNLRADIPGINHWFGDNLLEFDDKNRVFKQKKDIYYDADINGGTKVKLKIELDKTTDSSNQFSAKHKSYARLDFAKPKGYSIAIAYFKMLEDFFNFVFPETTNQYHFQSRRERRGQRYSAMCDIIATRHINSSVVKRDSDYSVLFGFSDVAEPSVVIRGWINGYLKFERVWESLKYIKTGNLSDEARFLSLVGAIENIHRSYFEKIDDETRKQHKQRLLNIASKLDSAEDKALIKTRLRNAYEQPLSLRLHQINEIVSAYGITRLTDAQEKKIIDTRHDRIHSLKADESKLLTPSEMFSINMILAMQVKAVLLAIIGVKADELKKIVAKSSQFRSYYRD